MPQEQETALVRKAREGDTAAFGEIVRRYQNLVYATAFQILRDRALAEDVAQEAFVTAFQSLRDLRTESSFPPWLRKIARNLALASRKEQRRFGALEEAGVLQSPSADAEQEVERERRDVDAFGEEVGRIVSSLSDTLRFPVMLCHIDDFSTRDAARFLGITEGALRKRLHDGKKKLQERIVRMAAKSFQVYRLPPDFAKRCICGCRRARAARTKRVKGGDMMAKKMNCGCGCVPPGKTAKRKVKTGKV
ncbi:MAG TPA: RNA polymerase sigma factor, partial [Candidatus Methylomirabilis sp.]|nr:RNA polymerase sigma factor [Candidatus Methylomirabilis sp.]